MRTGTSTSRHRRKKRDFIARLHRRRRLGHFLVDRDAKRTPLRKRSLPSAAAGHQLRAQARDRGDSGRNIELLAGPAELLDVSPAVTTVAGLRAQLMTRGGAWKT